MPLLTVAGQPAPEALAAVEESSRGAVLPEGVAAALAAMRRARVAAADAAAAAAARAGLPWPPPASAPPPGPPPQPPLAWHPARPRLAAADGGGRVLVSDHPPPLPGPTAAAAPRPPAFTLAHAHQQGGVTSLAWRPCAGFLGGGLAVGTPRGVLLWRLPPPPSGSRWGAAASQQQQQPRPPTARFFPSPSPVTALAWSPCGRLLAVAGAAPPAALTVWEVGRGAPTRLAAGVGLAPAPSPSSSSPHPPSAGGHTLLSWSPDGGRLLAGGPGAGLCVWECGRWDRAAWPEGGPGGGRLVGAAWAPAGDAALLAFSLPPPARARGAAIGTDGGGGSGGGGGGGGAHLASLAFTRPPPSLASHLLPCALPPGVDGRALGGAAWAPIAGRLVLSLEGGGPAAGEVALLAAAPGPVLRARLVGLISVGRGGEGGGGGAGLEGSAPVVALADAGATGGAAVGALLAARAGVGRVEVIPLAVRL